MLHDLFLLLARLLLGIPFIIWGIMKLRGGEAKLVPVLAGLGLPDSRQLAWLVALCELCGGILVVFGYPIGLVSVALGLWCLATGIIGHKGNLNEQLSHVAMTGGYFALAMAGPGGYALFGGVPTGIWAWLP